MLAARKLAEMERQSERLREMLGAWRNSSRRPNASAIMGHANGRGSNPRRDRQGPRSSEAICAMGGHDRTDSGADRMPKLHRLLRHSHFETEGRQRDWTKLDRVRPESGSGEIESGPTVALICATASNPTIDTALNLQAMMLPCGHPACCRMLQNVSRVRSVFCLLT